MTVSADPPRLTWEPSPLRELLRLAWPMVISLVSFSVITLVDTLFIGRLGKIELAAAGLGGVCSFTVASFGLAVFSAAKVQVGEQHGQGSHKEVESALGAFIRLALLMSVGSVLAGEMMALGLPYVSAHEQTGHQAGIYVAVRSLGLPFILLSAAVGQWLSSQGDSKSAMRAAVVANIANVPLNALLIFGLDQGLLGAAVASALSRMVEAGWLLRAQIRGVVVVASAHRPSPGLHFAASSWAMARRAFRRGLPTGTERVLDMLAFAAVPLLLSQLGPAHVAAHQIVLQIMLLSFLPALALSEALSVLVAQGVGANRPALVRRISLLGVGVSVAYSLACAILVIAFSASFVSPFTKDIDVIDVATSTLLFAAILQFLNGPYVQLKGILRGLSVFRFVAWVTVLCAWTITPPLTYLLGVRAGLGAPGAWLTLCLEVSLGMTILLIRLREHPFLRRVARRDVDDGPVRA